MPYIVVQVSINGQPPLPFVVDTGATGALLFVEPWAATKLGLPFLTTNKDQAVPGQGQKTLTSTVLKTLKILGTNKHNNFNLTFKPNDNASLKKDTPFQIISVIGFVGDLYWGPQQAGIIPVDLLRLPADVTPRSKMIWQIDFQRKLLILTQNTRDWRPVNSSIIVPLHRDGDLYSVSAGLATDKTLDFELDTGCPDTEVHDMAALPLFNGQSTQDLEVQTNRQYSYDTVLLPQLRVGALIEPNVPIHETATLLNTANTSGFINILGLDFLSRFLVTLDFAENNIYLKRRFDYAQHIVPRGRAGVRLEKRAESYIAAWVEPGSPAEQAGLHTDDQIMQVDGQPLKVLPWSAAQDLLDGFEGTTAKLKVRTAEGKEVPLSFLRSKKFIGRRHALLGVSLDWVQGNLMVSGVTAGSPLDHTLKWGDDIYFINGPPVAKMTMDEAVRQLERPDVALQIWRDSDKTWQELHLAPLPTQTQVLVGPLPAVNRYSFDSKTGWTAAPL